MFGKIPRLISITPGSQKNGSVRCKKKGLTIQLITPVNSDETWQFKINPLFNGFFFTCRQVEINLNINLNTTCLSLYTMNYVIL